MTKILYIENGRATDACANLFADKFHKTGICNLNRINLLRYDVIIVPSYSNQDILVANFNRLKHFLKYGGILILLGASQDKVPWLPYCDFQKPYLEKVKFNNKGNPAFRVIFNGALATQDAITFHDDFVSHGSFVCSTQHCIPFITADDTSKLVFAIVEPHGLSGKILVSTLDPDHHAVSGYTRLRMDSNPRAQSLFSNIVSWAENEVQSKGQVERIPRYLVGISRKIALQSAVFISLSICFLAILSYLFG